jgi:hypothetical protein
MADEELEKSKILTKSQSLLDRNIIFRRIASIIDAGTKFHADLWSDDPKVRQATEEYMKKHAREYHARMKSFAMFFAHYGPKPDPPTPPSEEVSIDIEKLEEMQLSDEELKKIAGIKDKEKK